MAQKVEEVKAKGAEEAKPEELQDSWYPPSLDPRNVTLRDAASRFFGYKI